MRAVGLQCRADPMAFDPYIEKLGIGHVPQIVGRIGPIEQPNQPSETGEKRSAAGQHDRRRDVRA